MYVCVCVCVYLSNVSSLWYIRLDILDNLFLSIFISIFSNQRMDVMIFGWNRSINFPYLNGSQVLCNPTGDIISEAYIAKVQCSYLKGTK